MADLNLDVIEARVEATTPGPWTFTNDGHVKIVTGRFCDDTPGAEVASWIPDAENDAYCTDECRGYSGRADDCPKHGADNRLGSEYDTADAAFIAAARTDVPALIAELKRLRAGLPIPSRDDVARSVAWAWRHTLTTVEADYDIADAMLRLFGAVTGATP
jgi:hypothetical protein